MIAVDGVIRFAASHRETLECRACWLCGARNLPRQAAQTRRHRAFGLPETVHCSGQKKRPPDAFWSEHVAEHPAPPRAATRRSPLISLSEATADSSTGSPTNKT